MLAANQTRQEKSLLRAPFDARIENRFYDNGAVLASGAPLLVALEADRLEAEVGIPAHLLNQLTVGNPAIMIGLFFGAGGVLVVISAAISSANDA